MSVFLWILPLLSVVSLLALGIRFLFLMV
jgi:hypothetical protein